MSSGDAPPRPPALPPPLKKPVPGQAWSDQETAHLIAAYEEKWFSLKRGQLKAQQWEEVAASLNARSGPGTAPRTGTQCRHKMEKLRKRYRAERQWPGPGLSRWVHFEQMDQMERGPLPISIRPPPHARLASKGETFHDREEEEVHGGDESVEEEEDDDDEEEEEEERLNGNMRSINGIHGEGGWRFPRVSRKPRYRREEEGDEEVDERSGEMKRLASVVRRFGEGFMRIEKRRMEMMRELERDWMEMEAKREEMLVESERYLVDTISRAFRSSKKAKKPPAET